MVEAEVAQLEANSQGQRPDDDQNEASRVPSGVDENKSVDSLEQLVKSNWDRAEFRTGTFSFFKLATELRNNIYEFAMTNNRDCDDRVIHVSDLNRRKVRRANITDVPMGTGLSKKSRALAKRYGFLSTSEANDARLRKRVTGVDTLLAVNLLRVSRQAYQEAIAVMYEVNTFAVIVGQDYSEKDVEPGFGTIFPAGIDVARIHRLQIEYQLPDVLFMRPRKYRNAVWSTFREMHALKHLHIIVTFIEDTYRVAEIFNKCWRTTTGGSTAMKDLIAAIPKWVNTVTWGLSKEQKESGDYGGVAYAKGCVLRKIWRTYAPIQGTETDLVVTKPSVLYLQGFPVDGDEDDSDEEEKTSSEGQA